ncbi:MAG: hypothetical protein ACLS4Z_00165 [Christensenellaceae bacterium]
MNKREMDTLMKKVAEGDNDAFARPYGAAARACWLSRILICAITPTRKT